MPYSYHDWPAVTNPALPNAYAFTKEFLQLNHIVAILYAAHTPGATFEVLDPSMYEVTGTSGAAVVTLNGLAPTLFPGDFIRIKRVTPAHTSQRLVDFQAGSLSERDLDTSALQTLFIAQEVLDDLEGRMGKWSDGFSWDAQGNRIRNVGRGTLGTDAARLSDVWDIVLGTGNLPPVSVLQEGSILGVYGGNWTVIPPTVISALISAALGTAAFRNVGTLSQNVPTIAIADARYMVGANNLSDITDPAAARTALGLGTAAELDHGIAALNAVRLDANARYPGADGRNIDLSMHALNFGRIDSYAEFSPSLPQGPVAASYAVLQLQGIGGSQHNTGGNIAVDTLNDRFTLASGGYRIRVYLVVTNTTLNNPGNFQWKLRRDLSVDQYESPVFVVGDGANGPDQNLTIVREIYFNGSGTFDILVRDTQNSGADLTVVDGQIVIEKLT